MAFANPNYTDVMATAIESRTRTVADNVSSNNALLAELRKSGRQKTVSGGTKILQELSFSENANAGWYSGYDILPTGVSDVISSAEYPLKQAAVPVTISGLEQLQVAGEEQMIDLMESRLEVAEDTMVNLLTSGVYADGTAAGGKQIDGLEAMLPLTPAAAPYGGIDPATFTFWQNKVSNNAAADPTTIQAEWNNLYAQLVRGRDAPNLIVCDSTAWETYLASLQAQQRFTNTDSADAGFAMLRFMTAKVVLDGGIYTGNITGATGAPAGTAFFINTRFLHWRPHARRNIVPLAPNKRYAVNQDAEVQIMAWAGNLTCSGRMFQGRWDGNA